MKKIVVLGASGMAGHVIYTYLQEHTNFEVLGTTNLTFLNDTCIQLNIFDHEKVEAFIVDSQPDVVINCIGSLIQESRVHPERTIYSNAYFPYLLKKCVAKVDSKLIHLSTDCVFSGREGNYHEDSFKDATDIYGLSKSLGEIDDDTNLTIRTSIIGPEIKKKGEGLFHWFMNQQGTINGFKSNFWSGVTTLELAKFIDWEIHNPQVGLKHLTNGIPISKFDLLNLFNNIYNHNLTILDNKDYVCNKSLVKSSQLDYTVPSYATMLEQQKAFMLEHAELYAHYQY